MCVSSSDVISAAVVHQRALDITNVRRRRDRQIVYPQVKFLCNGTITKWIYGANEMSESNTDSSELQIWRQTGPDTYTKQGFSSVTANATASPNVHEYYPQTPLQFQQGDILGVFYPEEDDSNIDIYVQRNSGPSNFFINGINPPAPNTLTISHLRVTNNDFPLVSLVIGKPHISLNITHSAL